MFMGLYPTHSSTVTISLNPTTSSIISQFYVIHDELFIIIHNFGTDSLDVFMINYLSLVVIMISRTFSTSTEQINNDKIKSRENNNDYFLNIYIVKEPHSISYNDLVETFTFSSSPSQLPDLNIQYPISHISTPTQNIHFPISDIDLTINPSISPSSLSNSTIDQSLRSELFFPFPPL